MLDSTKPLARQVSQAESMLDEVNAQNAPQPDSRSAAHTLRIKRFDERVHIGPQHDGVQDGQKFIAARELAKLFESRGRVSAHVEGLLFLLESRHPARVSWTFFSKALTQGVVVLFGSLKCACLRR